MLNLAFRSIVVLGFLWGLVFAVGVAVLWATGMHGTEAVLLGVAFALAIGFLQFLVSPWIIQWIYKINWVPVDSVDPLIAAAVREVAQRRGMPVPRFGVIEDGNPNAFTFGHYPGDARVVVTRGLLDLCDPEERKAVVMHEMGHIAHWDFVVMTIAATVPLVLYMIFRFTLGSGGDRRGRGGAYAAVVGLTAYVFYLISQYVVLFLSRVREYYADRFSAQMTQNPNSLATALVKVAYGLASAPKEVPSKKEAGRMRVAMAGSSGMRAMGIFDPGFGASLALAAAGGYSRAAHSYETDVAVRAMRWDLWNPWALVCEINSSHPLPAKRIQALGRLSQLVGQKPVFEFPPKPAESYWDEFFTDVLVKYLPLLGFLAGLGTAFALGLSGAISNGEAHLLVGSAGAILTGLALGCFCRVLFMYPKRAFPERKVSDLVGEVKVSQIRCFPATLRGTVIGRGIPGLYWSKDLVVQDDSGFMVLIYRQPLRILEFLFGLFRAESFIGQPVVATGWYRRFPRPYLELWQVQLPNGELHTCHSWAVSFYGSLIFSLLGIAVLVVGMVLQMGA